MVGSVTGRGNQPFIPFLTMVKSLGAKTKGWFSLDPASSGWVDHCRSVECRNLWVGFNGLSVSRKHSDSLDVKNLVL